MNAVTVTIPLADGGDGTLEALHMAVGGELVALETVGPLNDPVQARWLKVGERAVVELASVSGLALLDGKLDALNSHTLGTGEVLRDCLKCGATEIVVAVGGSASTDGGTGILRALGARFLDKSGRELPLGGGALLELDACDLSKLSMPVAVRVATDVTNPLLGSHGAAAVFAPQKGAGRDDVNRLEEGLARLADVLEAETGRRCRDTAGSGAAGGTAFGLACALGAQIISGFDWIADIVNLDQAIAHCDVVVSAEGKLDSQSIEGKVIGGLIRRCARFHKPLWVLPGQVESGFDAESAGIDRILAVSKTGQSATSHDLEHASCDLVALGLPHLRR